MAVPDAPLVDSHCHLDVDAFDADRDAVIERARAAGVARQVLPAVDPPSWPRLDALCRRQHGLFAAYGLHPVFLDEASERALDALPEWLATHDAVAVGECGLDYYVEGLDLERQRRVFERQLAIARDAGLPVVVHALRAVEDVMLMLRGFSGLRGVVHSYSGSPEQARQLWDQGFLTGFGGPVTYERARRIRRLVREMPLEFLLLESDAPDQPDSGHRGQRNEPARLVHVLHAIAELRDEDPAHIAQVTTANAERLFGLGHQQS